MNWVWENSPAKGTELLLLLAIADAADDQGGNAFPSVNTLARKTRMSRRTVQRLVGQLESEGLITVRQAGGRDSNRYTILMTIQRAVAGAANALSTRPTGESGDESHEPLESPSESTRGVKMTPRQNDTGDTATTPQGRHSYDTPGVTQLCRPTHPVTVLYPSSTADGSHGPVAEPHGGGGEETAEEATEPADPRAITIFRSLGPRWRIGTKAASRLTDAVSEALAGGWNAEDLVAHLGASPEGVRSPYAVLKARLADLPAPPARPTPRPSWCGECHQTTRLRDTATGAMRCPSCHPAVLGGTAHDIRRTS
jgi:DNA-binding MarR family transcriptional regulator